MAVRLMTTTMEQLQSPYIYDYYNSSAEEDSLASHTFISQSISSPRSNESSSVVGNRITPNAAVKFMARNYEEWSREVTMLAKLQHPRVIGLIGCSSPSETIDYFIVMELAQTSLMLL